MEKLSYLDLQQMKETAKHMKNEAIKTLFSAESIIDSIEIRQMKMYENKELDNIEKDAYEKEWKLKPTTKE